MGQIDQTQWEWEKSQEKRRQFAHRLSNLSSLILNGPGPRSTSQRDVMVWRRRVQEESISVATELANGTEYGNIVMTVNELNKATTECIEVLTTLPGFDPDNTHDNPWLQLLSNMRTLNQDLATTKSNAHNAHVKLEAQKIEHKKLLNQHTELNSEVSRLRSRLAEIDIQEQEKLTNRPVFPVRGFKRIAV